MDNNRSQRIIGIDILRILSMVFITVIHYIGYSEIIKSPPSGMSTMNYAIMTVFSSISKAAVNVFVIISGYFLYNRTFELKRIFKLWLEVFFYAVVIFIICACFGWGKITIGNLLKTAFPFLTIHYWFVVTYVLMCLLSPLMNAAIDSMPKEKHLITIVVAGAIITIYMMFNPFVDGQIYVGHSHGIVWFAYLYIVGAYLGKYSKAESKIFKIFWRCVALFSFVGIYAAEYIQINLPNNMNLTANNSLLPFILSVSVFILMKDISIKKKTAVKVISQCSACSLGVYLIQEHNMFREFFWGIFKIRDYAGAGGGIYSLTSL